MHWISFACSLTLSWDFATPLVSLSFLSRLLAALAPCCILIVSFCVSILALRGGGEGGADVAHFEGFAGSVCGSVGR